MVSNVISSIVESIDEIRHIAIAMLYDWRTSKFLCLCGITFDDVVLVARAPNVTDYMYIKYIPMIFLLASTIWFWSNIWVGVFCFTFRLSVFTGVGSVKDLRTIWLTYQIIIGIFRMTVGSWWLYDQLFVHPSLLSAAIYICQLVVFICLFVLHTSEFDANPKLNNPKLNNYMGKNDKAVPWWIKKPCIFAYTFLETCHRSDDTLVHVSQYIFDFIIAPRESPDGTDSITSLDRNGTATGSSCQAGQNDTIQSSTTSSNTQDFSPSTSLNRNGTATGSLWQTMSGQNVNKKGTQNIRGVTKKIRNYYFTGNNCQHTFFLTF